MTSSKRFLFEAPSTEPVILEINDDKITCVPTIDGLRLLMFTAIMQGTYSNGQRADEMQKFLKDCVVPEEWDRFTGLVAKYAIDIEGLGDMTSWLSDVYSERPTGPAQPSSDGQMPTGPSSVESSSSPESNIPV